MKSVKPSPLSAKGRNNKSFTRSAQVELTRLVVEWYLKLYRGTRADLGLLSMFSDPRYVGAFAVPMRDIRRGKPEALFRVLVVTTMFQRLRDALVFKILRGLSPADAEALSAQAALVAGARACACTHIKNAHALHDRCDLTKTDGRGTCRMNSKLRCPLKEHTVLLKRYGHFGKMPTSAALVLAERGGDLGSMLERVSSRTTNRAERSELMLEELKGIWRVSDKIAAMFLSAVSNADLSDGHAPWSDVLDAQCFVVIDSNVDLFLQVLGYRGTASYAARRSFIAALAGEIDLAQFDKTLQSNNPRLVQQAMYVFMGRSNRRENSNDCSHTPGACARCPKALRNICPVRQDKPAP